MEFEEGQVVEYVGPVKEWQGHHGTIIRFPDGSLRRSGKNHNITYNIRFHSGPGLRWGKDGCPMGYFKLRLVGRPSNLSKGYVTTLLDLFSDGEV